MMMLVRFLSCRFGVIVKSDVGRLCQKNKAVLFFRRGSLSLPLPLPHLRPNSTTSTRLYTTSIDDYPLSNQSPSKRMALDSNLFTLSFMRRSESPSIVDLYSLSPSHLRSISNATSDLPTSEKGIPPLYTRHRALNSPIYDSLILDGLVETPLSSLTASNTAEKKKQVKLHDPDGSTWLEKKGNTFHQDWTFEWER